MLLLVTVQAEQLPVAAIRGVVGVIVVPVMDGQLAASLAAELATALRAQVWEQLQSTGPIAQEAVRAGPPAVSYEFMQIVVRDSLIWHGRISNIDTTFKL
jgi:hypothetical protein